MTTSAQNEKKQINVNTDFSELRKMYESSTQNNTLNALVYGDFGTGKTYMLHTCPGPVFIDSFDPGGTKSLRKFVESGHVVADTRWEREESDRDARLWYEWEKVFRERQKSGFFNNVGTYVLDSLTTASAAIMAAAMRKNAKNVPISELNVYIPQLRDYQIQMVVIENIIKEFTGLPCHFICTAHMEAVKNDDGATIAKLPLVTGKLSDRLPSLFDEVYVTQTRETSSGLEYTILTRNTGFFKARSRLAGSYPINKSEPQDIKTLLKKCGFPYGDKDLHLSKREEQKQTT